MKTNRNKTAVTLTFDLDDLSTLRSALAAASVARLESLRKAEAEGDTTMAATYCRLMLRAEALYDVAVAAYRAIDPRSR